MRIFAGGHFINSRQKKMPSLFTCDMIEPNAVIVVNDKPFKWKEILKAELKDFIVTYEKDTPN